MAAQRIDPGEALGSRAGLGGAVGSREGLALGIATLAVTASVALSTSGVLSTTASTVIDDTSQLAGALIAAGLCWWTARRRSGVGGAAGSRVDPERLWRLLMAIAMGGWGTGQAIWSWYQIFGHTALPSPSLADVGFFMLFVFALPALMVLASDGTPRPARRTASRSRPVLLLDGLVVVGSLFIVTWSTALGAVVRAGAPTGAAFVVAIAYPVTDLILVVIVVLLVAAYRVPRRRRPLILLGLGLVGISVSDSIFAYLVSSGADAMPPASNIGFVAGPALIAVAALVRVDDRPAPYPARGRSIVEWGHVLTPYGPLAAAGVTVLVKATRLEAIDVYVGMLVVLLVVIRQTIALVDNSTLLKQIVAAQERLAYLAFHDPLTGLANRTLFRDRLMDAVEFSRENRRPIGLLFVDLDDFKVVNDSLGHAAGDLVLQAVGERLLACAAGTATTVARFGGDEFGVLLEGDVEAARRFGERVLAALRHPFDVGGRFVTVGASLGVVLAGAGDPDVSADGLLRRADAAMYAGKRRGKGGLVVYEPGIAAALGNPDLPTLLAQALRGQPGGAGIDVQYQPIVWMEGGATVAVEALARWTHPALGAVPPDVFVAAAERAGLVGELDNLVLDRAVREVAALAEQGAVLALHVNISASRLCEPELEAAVRSALDSYGLPGTRLVLEITETSRVPDLDAATEAIGRLRARGIRLAMDDFGTGYNTLAQLHLLPVDIVKLCEAHTALDGDAARVEALCASVMSICQALGLTVIAEGIETSAQAGALARLGCRLGQGFLYGRSAPLHDLFPATALISAVEIGAAE